MKALQALAERFVRRAVRWWIALVDEETDAVRPARTIGRLEDDDPDEPVTPSAGDGGLLEAVAEFQASLDRGRAARRAHRQRAEVARGAPGADR